MEFGGCNFVSNLEEGHPSSSILLLLPKVSRTTHGGC